MTYQHVSVVKNTNVSTYPDTLFEWQGFPMRGISENSNAATGQVNDPVLHQVPNNNHLPLSCKTFKVIRPKLTNSKPPITVLLVLFNLNNSVKTSVLQLSNYILCSKQSQ